MRRPTRAQWERWERIRRENDEPERRDGTYCRITEDPGPDYAAVRVRQRELDQFERATPLLVEDGKFVLLERPDGKLVRARIIGTRDGFSGESEAG